MVDVRLLAKEENNASRPLYEKVFTEDSSAFIDYYYFLKAKDNDIFVVEKDEAMRSMLHLNPYQLHLGKKAFLGHYIVGVATETSYRKRGYMAALLHKALHYMYEKKEPFTYLMPAREGIYDPYDFEVVFQQKRYVYTEEAFCQSSKLEDFLNNAQKSKEKRDITVREANFLDVNAMSTFFHQYFPKKLDVYTCHDEDYYRGLLVELQAQSGGITLIFKDASLVALLPFYLEGSQVFLKEPLFALHCKWDFLSEIEQDFKPNIMTRILHLPSFLKTLELNNYVAERLNLSLAVLDPILQQNSKIWRLETVGASKKVRVKEAEDTDGVITIGALTSYLFGAKGIGEIIEEPDVKLSKKAQVELEKIKKFVRISLNEIV